VPKKYYDNEIAIITPPKYGAMKILLRWITRGSFDPLIFFISIMNAM
jgi:hypothetical protein